MKTIPETYRRRTFEYKLIEREGSWAIYSQRHLENEEPTNFELCRVRYRDAHQTPRFAVEAGEYLPSDGEWGRHGFTFWTLREARQRRDQIIATPHTKRTKPTLAPAEVAGQTQRSQS